MWIVRKCSYLSHIGFGLHSNSNECKHIKMALSYSPANSLYFS